MKGEKWPAPSHAGWMAVVPVWAWFEDDACPTLKPRWFLPELLLELVGGLQAAACDVLGMEPVFRIDLQPITPRQARAWRAERWLAGERLP